jgi:hypothetical protein
VLAMKPRATSSELRILGVGKFTEVRLAT